MNGASTESVWQHLGDDLRTFLRRRVADEHVAEDLLQETFLRIHRGVSELKDGNRVTAWVYQIARNVIHDYYRRNRRGEAPLDALDVAADQPSTIPMCIRPEWIDELIGQLPEGLQDAVRLAEVEGLTQREVADRLGLTLSAAKSRVQRGRRLLREALDGCCTFQFDRRGNLTDVDPRPDRRVCRDCDE
jgi:RNA polymerase sigma-70 factor, ECF subfamily